MPKGKELSGHEKGQIDALHSEGRSLNYIAKFVRRSKCVVRNYLRDPDSYGTKQKSGRPPKVTARDKRAILKAASNSTKSCNQIKAENNLDLGRETIRMVIKKSPHIVRAKMKPAPRMKEVHKTQRLAWARANMARDWKTVNHLWDFRYWSGSFAGDLQR